MKPQTRRRGIKTQRVQQRAILRVSENAAVRGVCAARIVVANLQRIIANDIRCAGSCRDQPAREIRYIVIPVTNQGTAFTGILSDRRPAFLRRKTIAITRLSRLGEIGSDIRRQSVEIVLLSFVLVVGTGIRASADHGETKDGNEHSCHKRHRTGEAPNCSNTACEHQTLSFLFMVLVHLFFLSAFLRAFCRDITDPLCRPGATLPS